MGMETINVTVNPKEYFNKMSPEDSAEITTMCLDKICDKAEELRELYIQLTKSYGIEMGICDITLLVQVSAPVLETAPVRALLGTTKDIRHALATMMNKGLEDLSKIEKEEG